MTSTRPKSEIVSLLGPELSALVEANLPSGADVAAAGDLAIEIGLSIATAASTGDVELEGELQAQLAAVAEIHEIKLSKATVRTFVSAARLAAKTLTLVAA